MDATTLLRPGLLDGVAVAQGGGTALGAALAALGARTPALEPTLDEERAAEGVRAAGQLHALVHDLRPAFAADGLRPALDLAWVTVRAVATAAFIPAERGGRIALVAPPPSEDPPAAGLRAATENLARTLSIEWARYGIRTVAIAPGTATTDAELAALAAYLASPAGDYFSGCCLTLGAVAPA